MLLFERYISEPNGAYGAYVINGTSGESWTVPGDLDSPSVSPDGKRVLFARNGDIFVSDLRGRKPVRLVDDVEDEWILMPGWSTDGEHIAYYAWYDVSEYETVLRVYRSRIVPTVSEPELVHVADATDEHGTSPSIFADGSLILARVYNDTSGIYVVRPGDRTRRWVIATTGGSVMYAPAWSPDGTQIAYIEESNLTSFVQVKIVGKDGGDARTVASVSAPFTNQGQTASLAWSGDGNTLAFTVRTVHQTSHVYVVGQDGSGLTQITSLEGVWDYNVSWSR
jgi:Tol biopolymer transport system component